MANESLHSLIVRAKAGDEEAITAILTRFQPLIRKYVRQADAEDAKDMEQELVMRLIVLIRSYREELPYGFMELVEQEVARGQTAEDGSQGKRS